jgi:hypothetical protein
VLTNVRDVLFSTVLELWNDVRQKELHQLSNIIQLRHSMMSACSRDRYTEHQMHLHERVVSHVGQLLYQQIIANNDVPLHLWQSHFSWGWSDTQPTWFQRAHDIPLQLHVQTDGTWRGAILDSIFVDCRFRNLQNL